VKNAAEIKGSRAAHLRDGAAVGRFLAWLDQQAPSGRVDEIEAVRQLESERRATNQLREISEATNRKLRTGELFLIDSGGQYLDGTTDITRTVAIGKPTEEMRMRFTLVLQGHVAIATALFPKGTRGIDLDPLARRALWAHGLDYDHGTGHGVGSYLSVHEGPQSISRAGLAVLEPGMICSNEPGYYKEGAYGIRIENLVLVTEPQAMTGGDREVMGFETLTLAPIDRRLIVRDILSAEEITWLNAYHGRVMQKVGQELDAEPRAWLKAATAPL
jgi:Xaa-Pro aminopeptidase